MNSKKTRYTDFLNDKDFIRWQLMSDEKLNYYWLNFVKKHPEHTDEMQKAISYLQKKGLNKSTLNEDERIALLKKIKLTIQSKSGIKHRKLFWYISASAAAIVLIVIGISLFYPSSQRINSSDKELITGELMNNKDIQLIIDGESILFQNDVDVTLKEEGTAEIAQSNVKETSKIQIARDKFNSLVVPYGKRSTLTLADGSKVWLNSGSVLEFPAQFSGKKREIRLTSGEMYVEVTHDTTKPFYVQTANFNIKVYGTKFNISNYTDAIQSVVLVEGSISLQSKLEKELFLTPSQQAIYSDNGTFKTEKVEVERFVSWKEGFLTFNKTPMTEVLEQIGRYYNLVFDFEKDTNLQKRTCTGKIFLSDNLDNVMTTIALLTSTEFEIQENIIYITNKLT